MKSSRIKSMPGRIVQTTAMLFFLLTLAVPCHAVEEESAAQKATQQATEAVNESAQAVTDSITTLQQRASDSRLVNRTSDDLVALVLMGVLVASISGVFSRFGCSGLGLVARIGLGLVGAYIGSMAVRIAQIDLGWSEVIMSYEELLFSLLGAVAIVGSARIIQRQMKKKKKKSES